MNDRKSVIRDIKDAQAAAHRAITAIESAYMRDEEIAAGLAVDDALALLMGAEDALSRIPE